MTSIDVSKRLPESVAIKSVDNELYRIGCLCRSPDQTNDDRGKGRHPIHHPILVFAVLVIELAKSIISLNSNDVNLAIYLGDFPMLTGVGYNMHIILIIFSLYIKSEL